MEKRQKNKKFNKFIVLFLALFLTLVNVVSCNNKNQQNSSVSSGLSSNEINIVAKAEGGNNLIAVEIERDEGVDYNVYYLENGEYKLLDSNLIKVSESQVKAEILGLKSGSYSVRVDATKNGATSQKYLTDISVSDIDRSGYAHFNKADGVGAYNIDGTLKENTTILYLTNQNKNTLTANFSGKQYVGIADILTNLRHATSPVLIRIEGKIETNQWKAKDIPPRLIDNSNFDDTFFENEFENKVEENILGLSCSVTDAKEGKKYNYLTTKDGVYLNNISTVSKNQTIVYDRSKYAELKGKEVYADDCNFNMVTVKNANNVTLEGVFEDASLYQWGITFRDCNSIEVKNLTFDSYTEDAVSFYTTTNGTNKIYPYKNFFVTNCVFLAGKNNWDVTGERDKYKGDGSIDLNQTADITISYSRFYECKKTVLISSNSESNTKNVTMHHNYFYGCESRLPLTRHSNIHIYNNHFSSCNSCLNANDNAYIFSENNYFDSCKNVMKIGSSATYSGAAIKSFNDFFYNCDGNNATRVSSRTSFVPNACDVETALDYTTFDTNKELFYYDEENRKSNVLILNEKEEVPSFVAKHSGIAGKYQKLFS